MAVGVETVRETNTAAQGQQQPDLKPADGFGPSMNSATSTGDVLLAWAPDTIPFLSA